MWPPPLFSSKPSSIPIRKCCHVKRLLSISFSLLPLASTNLNPVSMDQPILCISYKRNHTIWLVSCLVSFTYSKYFWGSPAFPHASVLHSFLWLADVPLYGYTTVCLSIHLLKEILVTPSFWQLWIKPLQTFTCRFFGRHKFST